MLQIINYFIFFLFIFILLIIKIYALYYLNSIFKLIYRFNNHHHIFLLFMFFLLNFVIFKYLIQLLNLIYFSNLISIFLFFPVKFRLKYHIDLFFHLFISQDYMVIFFILQLILLQLFIFLNMSIISFCLNFQYSSFNLKYFHHLNYFQSYFNFTQNYLLQTLIFMIFQSCYFHTFFLCH